MAEGKLIIFSAPSGSGKTTIVKEVMKISGLPFSFSVSATSRPARDGEKDGVDYYFLSPEEFRLQVAKGLFLEWEEVYDNQYYGTLLSEVERIKASGVNVLFDVDVIGGLNIKKMYGNEALAIFVQPPNIEILKERLRNRGTETPESFLKRIEKATYELTFANKFDVIIINNELKEAVNQTINAINTFLNNE